MADQGDGDEEVVAEEGATGRRWGIALVGMGVGVVLGALGIVLDRSYLVYPGAAIFGIFGLTAAGISRGWFNIPGIGGGGGSFPPGQRRIESSYVVDDEPKQQPAEPPEQL